MSDKNINLNYREAGDHMKTKSPVIALAICLLVLTVCLSPAAYGKGGIDLIADQFVSNEAKDQARLAVNTTLKFFHNTYGLSLEKDVQVYLVTDRTAYKRALKRWYDMNEAEAAHRAQKSAGTAGDATIVVDVGDIRSREAQLFCLCHEIVHQFQGQASRGRTGSIMWVAEGVAEALAAQILATAGVTGGTDYQNRCLSILKKATSRPRLENLHTLQDWFAAIEAHGSMVTYGTATVAVLALVQRHGYEPLFIYFRALNQASPEDAFYQAFGVKVSSFERDFHPF